MSTRLQLICVAVLAALGGAVAWHHAQTPRRPQYVLINETGQHDFDLAFRMSLKLAENKSGIENALVLLQSLPPAKTIEETAADLLTRLQIGARRNGRGILYLYAVKENLLKIEVSYALEGDIPDAFCHRLEEAAKTYMLSEVPQDFISELIITTNLRGMGSKSAAGGPIAAAMAERRVPVGRRRRAGAGLQPHAGGLSARDPPLAGSCFGRTLCRRRTPPNPCGATSPRSRRASAIRGCRY